MAHAIPQSDHARTAEAERSSAVHQRDQASPYPIFISTDQLLGCELHGAGKHRDAIQDLLVHGSKGCIEGLLLESGAVAPIDSVRWDPKEQCFLQGRAPFHKGGPKGSDSEGHAIEASAKKSDSKKRDEESSDSPELDRCFLLSKAASLTLLGYERNEEGERIYTDLGSFGGAYVDVQSGNVAYLSTSQGGVFGIGEESHLIPWSALDLRCDADGTYYFWASVNAKRLEDAPTVGGDPTRLSNPEYRDSIYSYYGADRADFDQRPDSEGSMSVISVDRMLGARVVRMEGSESTRDTVDDLVFDPDTANISFALLESGSLVPIGLLEWNTREQHFSLARGPESGDAPEGGRKLLASVLSDYDVTCGDENLGNVESMYFDCQSGKIVFVAVDHDGLRVLPWSLVSIQSDGQSKQFVLSCSKRQLQAAPVLDGKMGATVYSPAFQERVSALEPKDD